MSVLDMKIMVLDEFEEELGESKAISLADEDGLGDSVEDSLEVLDEGELVEFSLDSTRGV